MSVQDDASVPLFFGGQCTAVVDVHKSNDFRVGCFSATILKHLYMHARRVVLAQVRRDLDRAVDHGIVPYKSADETDDDDWRRRNSVGRIDRACRLRVSGDRGEAKNERNAWIEAQIQVPPIQ